MTVPVHLEKAGAVWWHTDDYHSPRLYAGSLGSFFYAALMTDAHIGHVWSFRGGIRGTLVKVSVYCTVAQKEQIESQTRFRLSRPPTVHVGPERTSARAR